MALYLWKLLLKQWQPSCKKGNLLTTSGPVVSEPWRQKAALSCASVVSTLTKIIQALSLGFWYLLEGAGCQTSTH